MRKLIGTIVSAKMPKTVVVRVDRLRRHRVYQKDYRVSRRMKAHAEGDWQVGDRVVIAETRPISREKRWKVIGLVRRIEPDGEDSSETKP